MVRNFFLRGPTDVVFQKSGLTRLIGNSLGDISSSDDSESSESSRLLELYFDELGIFVDFFLSDAFFLNSL